MRPVVAMHTPTSPTGDQIGPHQITVDGVLVGETNLRASAVWMHDELVRDTKLAVELRDFRPYAEREAA